MTINKYINWNGIWEEEVCLETSIEMLEDDDKFSKPIRSGGGRLHETWLGVI